MINYAIVGGALPEGSRITSDKGVMKIGGVLPMDPSFNPPVFVTPAGERLGILDELVPASISIDVDAQGGKSLVGLVVAYGTLPWGLKLIGNTITGSPAEMMQKESESFLPEDAPKWNTKEGQLASINELQSLTLTLSTDKASDYRVISGALPWGLKLYPEGLLTGTAADIGGPRDPAGPSPLWNTARGIVAEMGEDEVATGISLEAIPRTGDKVFYDILSGALPWGLKLNGVTGSIYGKTGHIAGGGEDESPAQKIKPTLDPGSFNGKVGTQFSTTLSPVIPQGRTLQAIRVVTGGLPFGLTLVGTTISGTPKTAGSFTCELVVSDSKYVYSIPTTFTFEVTA